MTRESLLHEASGSTESLLQGNREHKVTDLFMGIVCEAEVKALAQIDREIDT